MTKSFLFFSFLFSVETGMFTLSHAPPRLSFAGTFQKSGGLAKSPSRLFHSLSVGSPPLKDLSDEGEDGRMLPSLGYKWCLIISYDGTRFSGWQYQTSTPTVQCLLEEALIRITKLERDHLCVVGAGRTDAGVHAWGQVAHFTTPFNYDCLAGVHKALNGLLPPDIRIREMRSVPPEFHARFSVTSKIYNYRIYNDTIMDPFLRLHVYHSTYKLNPAAMRDAAKNFVGKHDFSAFANTSRNDRIPNPVKNIFRFDVIETGPVLHLEVEGTGFLYRQVRNMVALLLQVGREAVPPDIVSNILASRDRKELAKFTLAVPPHGLCLHAVNYNEDQLQLPSGCPATSRGRHHTISKCKLPYY
ncbi:tRNA pseudouridine synthase A 1-like isoform X1 [Salvia splendens]|uniref:tRNA pseudouridine synthase A 1-like isoform X1 n=2 Tax=Salvia splendens TaxID=180675 RepID=UPI001C272CFD|nr:tRNA pseudouridine synthase A 1-like isoform X1 [Salvia splendens]